MKALAFIVFLFVVSCGGQPFTLEDTFFLGNGDAGELEPDAGALPKADASVDENRALGNTDARELEREMLPKQDATTGGDESASTGAELDAGNRVEDAGPLWPGPDDPNKCGSQDDCADAASWCEPYGARVTCWYMTCACDFSHVGLLAVEVMDLCTAQCQRAGWSCALVKPGLGACICANQC